MIPDGCTVETNDHDRQGMGTTSADKYKTLFSHFGINLKNEPGVLRRGGIIYREVGLNLSGS